MNKDIFKHVVKAEDGYYCLKDEYRRDMSDFYENTYYQQDYAAYAAHYDDVEVKYQKFLDAERMYAFTQHTKKNTGSILDLGCGEGHSLANFAESGYDVCGVDFSIYAVKHHHPDMVPFVKQGDLYENMLQLKNAGIKFD